MKYYIKDNTVYIKYISALDGKLKTLEFDIETDKEFLKKLFNEKKEETQIFMLDDTIREQEHPTDENMEYTTILTLAKPKQADEKQKKYDFYKIKLEEQKAKAKELEKVDKTGFNDEKKLEWEKQVKDTKSRIEAYENEMRNLVKTEEDILAKPKSEDILALEKLLKGNIKDANKEAKDMIKNILIGKGLTEEQINNLMSTSKDFKDLLSKITFTPDEKNDIVNELVQRYYEYDDTRYKFSQISEFKIPDFKELTIDEINHLKMFYDNLIELINISTNDNDIVYYNLDKATPDIPAKYYVKKIKTYKQIERPDKGIETFDLINNTFKNDVKTGKKPFRKEDRYILVKDIKRTLETLKSFIDFHTKRLTGGSGLRALNDGKKLKGINEKINILINQINTLKNEFINFKEDTNKEIKQLKEKPIETKKEIEIIKSEPKQDIRPKEVIETKSPDFLETIKNFSREKLKKTEPQKYEPNEKPSLLEETFKKRREAFEDSENEENEEEEIEWD